MSPYSLSCKARKGMAEKKSRGKVAETVYGLARPVVEGLGLSLWDVDFFREGAEYDLLVTVDRPGGAVGLEDCEAVSRALSPLLDEADPIEESYCLEVSSAGLGRELVRPEHFRAFLGKPVLVMVPFRMASPPYAASLNSG